jgi:hypothetical protein
LKLNKIIGIESDMTIEIESLVEVWNTCKEYIPERDRQAAADHILSVIFDYDLTDREVQVFGNSDKYLRSSLKNYFDEQDINIDDDEEF